jgi:hypothetical protein
MASCQLVNRYRCFGGACCLHPFSSRRIPLFLECLSPENGDYKLFLNVSDYLPVDMAIPEDLNRLISIRFK